MAAAWVATIVLTVLSSEPAALDAPMVSAPHANRSAVRQACVGFERNAENLGWGKLKPVGSLPGGKLERLVMLNVNGCPAREAIKDGQVYLIQGSEAYLASASSRSGENSVSPQAK